MSEYITPQSPEEIIVQADKIFEETLPQISENWRPRWKDESCEVGPSVDEIEEVYLQNGWFADYAFLGSLYSCARDKTSYQERAQAAYEELGSNEEEGLQQIARKKQVFVEALKHLPTAINELRSST